MLNPEESQDEDDNVVVTDDSKEEPLGEAEVLGRRREGGRSCGGRWGGVTHSHPQDKSSDDEDNKGDKNSESEEESDGEESDEAERDGDVDQGFREQLMAVLQAGKALVSGSARGPRSVWVCLCPPVTRLLMGPLSLRAEGTVRTTTTRSWGTRP